jgi:hypothetical protein
VRTKTCTICKERKEVTEFYKRFRDKIGYRSSCKSCCSIKRKERYKNNRERELEQAKIWTNNNKEKVKIYKKKQNKEYYQKNRETILEHKKRKTRKQRQNS